ncbi:MAG: hypothetical protein ACI8W1_002556 [Candidatus Azotimanducaceae bacterium]|jgi:hypothetical protein
MKMKTVLRKHESEIALVIGNGVNQYDSAKQTNSWKNLLIKLSKQHLPSKNLSVPEGVALTEFYDVLELRSEKSDIEASLQKQFCDLMDSWKCYEHHKRIVSWAKKNNAPILTTNFESTLSDAGDCTLRKTRKGGFTDYYPWESYYSNQNITEPSREFAIWHVNGMQHYRRSIRLGLTHYMGSVARARGWLHKGNEQRLFSGKNVTGWDGADSWLHIIFNAPLLIFGLGLEENEVFFRWLLIERARYFKKFQGRFRNAWYVHVGDLENEGKKFFLEGVGIKPLRVESYDEIYGAAVWV